MKTDDFKAVLTIFIIWTIVALFLIWIAGCSTNLHEFKEPAFNQGCYASTVDASLGYLNQSGNGEACKVKCSEVLPENYCWEYNNQRTGCSAKVGECD